MAGQAHPCARGCGRSVGGEYLCKEDARPAPLIGGHAPGPERDGQKGRAVWAVQGGVLWGGP